MAVSDVTQATFADEVIGSPIPVVVDYWADWCAPCKQISPILEELSREYEGRVKFVKVDTNAEAGLAAQQAVLSLPTLQFFVDGAVSTSLSGAKPKRALAKVIDNLL